MPNKHGQKRTIKLRQAQAISYGRDFLKVGSGKNAHTYPKFPTFTIQTNPNWLKENVNWFSGNVPQIIGGEASIIELYQMQEDFWTQHVTLADFAEFMFTHTIFEGLLPNG